MDSRIYFVPQENELQFGPSMPVTPEKPTAIRSNSMPVGRHEDQLGRGNWQELVGCSGGYVQEMPNYSSEAQHFLQNDKMSRNGSFADRQRVINHIAGSYTKALNDDNVSWNCNSLAELLAMNNTAPITYPNRTPNRSVSMAERPLIPNLNDPLNSLRESKPDELFFLNHAHCSSSNLLSGHNSLFQTPQNNFSIGYELNYDLNSPLSIEADLASTVTDSSQYASIVQQANKLEEQLSALINSPQAKTSSEDRNKEDDLAVTIDNVRNEQSPDGCLNNIVDSSSALISKQFEEPKDSCQGGDQVFDLNKTPQQKTPKRRKHRPKVVLEGKPKRTPKAATTKIVDPSGKVTEKRKYARKKGQQESATKHPGPIGEAADSTERPKEKRKYVRKNLKEPETQNAESQSAASSCRRALNFEMENMGSERGRNVAAQQEILNMEKDTFNLNTDFQVAESFNKSNTMFSTKSDLQISQQNGSLLEIQQSEETSYLTPMNQISKGNQAISDRRGDSVQVTRKNGLMDNLNGSVRMLQDIHGNEIGRSICPAKTNCKSLEKNVLIMSQSTDSGSKNPMFTEGRGYKREFHHLELTRQSFGNPPDKIIYQETFHTDDYHLNSHTSSAACSETHKKQRIEHGIQKDLNGMPSAVAAVNRSREKQNSNDIDTFPSTAKRNRELFHRYAADCYKHLVSSGQNLSMQHTSAGSNSCIERTGENYNIVPPNPYKISRNQLQCNIVESTKQTVAFTQSLSVPSTQGKVLQAQMDVLKDQKSTAKRKGRQAKQKSLITVEEIICRMEHLNLNEMNGEGQTALVLYKGDGSLIPYEGVEFIKKRKPRPKVDLDPETERLWKLLMWKEGDEGLEGTNEENRQWWEEQRVFRGRADSFIARMHLVQGDRRFSKWKGSVVDSVIGVFLTQNVSDHLSSSAFINLAAKFPPKSVRNRNCRRDVARILIQEPDIYMLNQNDSIKWHEKLLTPFYDQHLKMPHELMEHRRDHETSWTERTSRVEAYSHNPEEEVLSSQDSFDSFIVQGNKGVRSYSGSNSEAEDPAELCKHSDNYSNTTNFQKMDRTSYEAFYNNVRGRSLSYEEFQCGNGQPVEIEDSQQWPRLDRLDCSLKNSSTLNQQGNSKNSHLQTQVVPSSNSQLYITPESGVLEVESLQLYREESISSWPSSTSRVSKKKDTSCTSTRVSQGAESVAKQTAQENRSRRYQENSIANAHAFLSNQLMHEQSSPQPYHGNQPHEMNKTFLPVNLGDAQGYRQSTYGQQVSHISKLTANVFDVVERIAMVDNKQTDSENNFIQSNSKEKSHFPNKAKVDKNSSKARKEKSENLQKDAVDWDSLRKQVLEKGRKKERSEDAMDSMDYKAMRNANVNEISEAIKERGMNNMLAERIKEFLNRLVEDHGSIDLEWLRDVPPHKAKDYLLSIRGLGLKSVECVRLLTLHHLAFPVDTNVGRIAVRLGWVPLQPLPESLQLHLLELYPILESIQKYLWPRLCKLDQQTLYELHYQMITFGKVFCTKSRPNCNACPMRAECRHFASAFASARLALPGPEDKSIVTGTVPLTTERSPGIIIDPLPLPPAEENSVKIRAPDIVSCIPIIEEPATPEQEHIEVIESDIEDVFDEDPDEIPTIKLNMEELTVNLQNYMQANMELQECDMSKALVALNPEAASIPTPKLKNISRLRTEHQVYELPDSHPLLKGMDEREPDDPSPYLLAIWTPGETANSIQPPEQHCQFLGPDKLCNEQTCFSCNSIREANSQTVRGTLLIPCRTAMRGSFPLNGTYFQVNEVFADHESSLNPIDVPRAWIWNLPRRMVYFGTSVTTIFKGLSTEGIQYCFWKEMRKASMSVFQSDQR